MREKDERELFKAANPFKNLNNWRACACADNRARSYYIIQQAQPSFKDENRKREYEIP